VSPETIPGDNSANSGLPNTFSKGEFCTIHFFGDFQLINSSGSDITRKFTPLLKELFLLIWFNSIRNDMGISNEKITEILWHGFSESSANNNKAVNIAKLRAILTKDLWCDLSYKETGYWKIDYKNKHIINDYYDFIKITSAKTELSKPDMLKLIEFGHKGALLSNQKYKWLDEFKEAVSNEMIDRLIRYQRILVIKDQPEHVIQVTDAIFNFDSVNEEAMENKCKASIVLGRHTVAKEIYDHFSREYRLLYNADYSKSFTTIAKP
jgi:two-component SAPR family response regulator